MTKDYPRWCCWECGVKHGTKKDRIASWHFGKCDVCELNNNVTEPRDFGHFANWFTDKGKKSYELQSSGGKKHTYFRQNQRKVVTNTTHYLSRKPIYLLSTGFLSESRALPEAAFKTKKAMMAFIKQEYPDARGTNRMEKNELYWEEHNIWLTAEKIILH